VSNPYWRCETCKWWGDEIGDKGRHECDAPIPESIADEFKFAMGPDEGATCPCWEAKE
jgi:hypothetical protein